MKRLILFLLVPIFCYGKLVHIRDGCDCCCYTSSNRTKYEKADLVNMYFDSLPNLLVFSYMTEKGKFSPQKDMTEIAVLTINERAIQSHYYQQKMVDGHPIAYYYFREDHNPDRLYMVMITINKVKESAIAILDQTL